MTPKLFAIATCCVALLMSGCASNRVANSEQLTQQAREMASTATLTPAEALTLAIGQMAQAQAEQLRTYAPSHLESADEALRNAQNLYDRKAPGTEILAAAFKVGSLLDAARTNRQVVESALAESLQHKAVLEELGTPALLPEDYADVVDEQTDLIRDIERGKLEQARSGEASLLKLMTKVEIKTLKTTHLVPAEQMLDKAEEEDADEYAEKTFEQAEKTLKSSHRFVESNFRDRAGVARVGIEALHAAQHAWQVGREAKQWVSMNKEAAEQKVLYVESLLERINEGVGVENLQTRSLAEQSQAMAEKIQRGEAKINQNVVVYGQSEEEATGLSVEPVTEKAEIRGQ